MRRRAARLAATGSCIVVSGCAAILGIDDGIPRDAGADATPDVLVEAGPDAAARCSPQKPFGTPVAVAALDTGNDEALARLSPDELTVYFERASGSVDLYVATRPSVTQAFDPPVAVTSINTPGLEADPSLAAGGKLFFVTDREGGAGAYDIWTASPDDAGFGSIAPLSGVGSTGNEQYPYALASSLYFTSDQGGPAVIYRADLSGASATNVTLVSPATDAGPQIVPVVSDDELVMYFAAASAPDAGSDYDIWMSTRTATSQPWSAPVRITELSTPSDELPSWLSPDWCRLYISTNRGGNYDIYLATRTP